MATRKKSGGAKGAIASFLSLILVCGLVVGWAKANQIKSIDDGITYFRAMAKNIDDCKHVDSNGKITWNCDLKIPSGNATKPETPNIGGEHEVTPPDKSLTGTNVTQPKDSMLKTLNTIKIGDRQKVNYDRSEWKHWIGSPCNTRMQVLKDQGTDVKTKGACQVTTGKWVDPFSGKTFTESKQLDIDHVIPLGYANSHGGNKWDTKKKEQFANDRIHLLAVSSSENRKKSDKGPADYMPPNKAHHCDYAKIWTTTVSKYDLAISKKDKAVLTSTLQKCS